MFFSSCFTEAYAAYGSSCSSNLCAITNSFGNTVNMVCQSSATGSNCPNTLSAYYCDCLSTQYYDTTFGCSKKN